VKGTRNSQRLGETARETNRAKSNLNPNYLAAGDWRHSREKQEISSSPAVANQLL
jgi:hypothetical protein